MKNFYSILFLLGCLPGFAQIKKGQAIWSAQISGQFVQTLQTEIKSPRSAAGVSGEAAFFVRDKLAIGLGGQGSWDRYRINLDESQDFKWNSRTAQGTVNTFVRKYWQVAPFLIYAGGGVNFLVSRQSNLQKVGGVVGSDVLARDFRVSLQTQLGVIYPVSRRLALEFGARSDLFPLSFNTAQLGLVILNAPDTKPGENNLSASPTAKGRWLLAGSFYHSVNQGHNADSRSRTDYHNPSTSIELAPGLFVRDRLLIGLGIFAGFQGGVLNTAEKAAYATVGDNKPILLGLRPSIKKYLSSSNLTPYLEGYVSYDRIIGGGGPATNTYNGGGNFGLAYTLGKNWIIEARLLGISGGYSAVGKLVGETATILGVQRFHGKLNAGLKPEFTVSYVFR